MDSKYKTPLAGGVGDCCSLNSDLHYTALELFERMTLALERSNDLARASNEQLEAINNGVISLSNRLEDLGRYL